MTLQQALELHISGRGTGFELDDIISCGRYPEQLESGLHEIAAQYRTDKHPVGVTNPASFDELSRLFAKFPNL